METTLEVKKQSNEKELKMEAKKMRMLIRAFGIALMVLQLSCALPSQAQEEKLGKAPDFELTDLEGKTINIEDYKGQIVVIHIATTWCPFCNAEAPHLQALYEDYKSKNVAVLIIDVKESKELVENRLRDRHQLTFPIVLDTDGEVAAKFAPADVLPDLARDEVMLASNLLIDPSGEIRFMSLLDSKNFDPKLMALKAKLDELIEAFNL